MLPQGTLVRHTHIIMPEYCSADQRHLLSDSLLWFPEQTPAQSLEIRTFLRMRFYGEGMIVGWTTRVAGVLYLGSYVDRHPNYLRAKKTFKVYIVEPITRGGRYRKPYDVLIDDVTPR